MSHSIETTNLVIHHNSDYAGCISFSIPEITMYNAETAGPNLTGPRIAYHPNAIGGDDAIDGEYVVYIPFQDLRTLFAHYVRDRVQDRLDEITDDDLLDITTALL